MTKFEGELVGLQLGIKIWIAAMELGNLDQIILLMDSQEVMERMMNPQVPKLIQYLLLQLQKMLNQIPPTIDIIIH